MDHWLFNPAFAGLGFILALIAVAHMLTQRRSPQSAIAWLLVMILVPWVGVPLYIMFGGRKMAALARSKSEIRMTSQAPLSGRSLAIDHLLRSYNLPPATSGNRFTLCQDGVASYEALIEVIEGAQHSIGYGTYILADDEVGRDVIRRLAEKAAAGVRVRLLLDGVGTLYTGGRLFTPLKAAGGEVVSFNPVLRRPLRGLTNLRNHRKIVVADGTRVWSGGCNTAINYIGPSPRTGRWRDLSFLLEGPTTQTYAEIFAYDWAFATKTQVEPNAAVEPLADGDQVAQVVPSGPDVPGDPLYAAMVSACYMARERIWLATPYFVPPEPATQALRLAARRGVEVKVIVPDKSNHLMPDLARGPDLRDVQGDGGQVLRYMPGMLHAKAMVVDGANAVVGSANFDDRSLFLNYEVMLQLYGGSGVKDLERWFEATMADCEADLPMPGRARDLLEGLAHTLSPVL
ncbi:MAG: phospholipase D-like domain-containing protein [Pseudomonadota bacterium]